MDVLKRSEELRRRRFNLSSREIEQLAMDAGWVFSRTAGSHVIYLKEGFRANLSIPRTIKGNLALKLLKIIEASVLEGEEAEDE